MYSTLIMIAYTLPRYCAKRCLRAKAICCADGCRRKGSEEATRSEHLRAAGVGGRELSSKDDELDGLHADLAASSLSG